MYISLISIDKGLKQSFALLCEEMKKGEMSIIFQRWKTS